MEEILKMAKELVNKLEGLNAVGDNKVQLSNLKAGEEFKTGIGNFIVLEQLDGQTKVITKDLYREDVKFDSNNTDYKTSELRELCDTEILEDFEGEFGVGNIIEHTASLMTVDGQKCFGTVESKVRPLMFDEVRQYNELLVNKDLPDWYWTCTSWSTKDRGWEYSVTVVSPSGFIDDYDYDVSCGVRPFCILNSNIFVSEDK